MKPKFLLLSVSIFLIFGRGLFSQDQNGDEKSKFYVGIVKVDKIYKTNLGYKIEYRDGNLYTQFAYIPNEWLVWGKDKKAAIFYGNKPSFPYMQVSYNDGKITYVRLYMRPGDSPYWGGFLDLSAQEDQSKEEKAEAAKPMTAEEEKEKDIAAFKSPPPIRF